MQSFLKELGGRSLFIAGAGTEDQIVGKNVWVGIGWVTRN